MSENKFEFLGFLRENDISHESNVCLTEYSWFKTGGRAGVIIHPDSIGQLQSVVRELNQMGQPFKVVGETSNLMFLDDSDYSCLVTTKALKSITFTEDHHIEAETGYLLPDLSRYALINGIYGFAGLEGIPGTIGGAVFMNAAAFNYSIADVFHSADFIMPDGSMQTLTGEEMGFRYRDSVLKRNEHPGIVAIARFHAKPGDPESIYREMEKFHAQRHKGLEYMYPNLGSIFVGHFYRSLTDKDLILKVAAAAFYFFNYRCRIPGRETPINRKWLNDLAVKRLKIKYDIQPFSDKSMNILTNRGQGTACHLDYIRQLQSIVGKNFPIENEIVDPF